MPTSVATRSGLRHKLTPRLIEILQLVADGWEQKELADKLGISTHHVKQLRSRIMDLLGADNMPNAVAMGFRKGLIQ